MIERESTGDGWQVRFPSTPALRLVRLLPAAFLAAWLCGWAAGEYFAGSALVRMLAERWAPGVDLGMLPRFHAPSGDAAVPILVFLTVWVTAWTFGGIFAIRQLLTLLFGEPVLCWSAAGVSLDTVMGPFRSRRRMTWEQAEALVGAAATVATVTSADGKTVPLSPGLLSVLRSLAGPVVEDADRETLLGWLREARGGASADAGAEPMRAIG
jgi:hypothetical protein